MEGMIECRRDVLDGKPCIRGTRISVEFILELLASGATAADIVRTYSQLTPEAVEAALRYAASVIRQEVVRDVALSA